MRKMFICLVSAGLLFAAALEAPAHYNIMLPADYSTWSASKGDTVSFRFIWGHGYEHIWFDATKPDELFALSPDGKKTDLLPALKPTKVRALDGKEYLAYNFDLELAERGDYLIAMKAALIWDEEEEIFLQDYSKSILHVQEKGGWDRKIGHKLELVPLTRPYGLQAGGVIQALVLYNGTPLAGCEVEFEKLQPKPPKEDAIPGEEFITFEAKTDPDGIVTFGLHEEGWFAITAVRESREEVTHQGHTGDLVERATLWINVAPLTVLTP